ncbi:Plexin [Gracilaria domingensis]|nr:Plexin [Gracilaria domingensis]
MWGVISVVGCFLLLGGRESALGAKATIPFDHLAHAVPGKDITVRDEDGDGFAEVTLNGELSHTHYFVPGPPAIVGKLVSYEWVDNSEQAVIGSALTVTYNFPVGVTTVTLTVADNSGDTSSNNISVTVSPSADQGAYLYFYDFSRISVDDGALPKTLSPQFGLAVQSLDFGQKDSFPDVPFISHGPFACKAMTEYLAKVEDEYVFYVEHGDGVVILQVDGKTVLRKLNIGTNSTSTVANSLKLTKGKHKLDLVYYAPDPEQAQLVLGVERGGVKQPVPPDSFSYESNMVLPTVHKITPTESTIGGGGSLKIFGAGFTLNSEVTIGPYQVEEVYVRSDSQIHIKVPVASGPADVLLSVTTSRGQSNPIHFMYTEEALMPIKFKEDYVRYENGTLYPSEQFATVALGPDLRYYFGSLDTHIHVLTLEHKRMVVKGYCKSESAGPSRSITGVSFNPADTTLRVYIATNTFYWKNWGLMADEDGWHNGKIETFVPSKDTETPEICLLHEEDLVTGLPVSNHDHGVNSLIWDNNGNLYAQIGGFTNAGHSVPGDLVGGVPESVLSGATIVIHIRAPGFDGHVKYDQYADPGTAKKVTPDKFVEGYGFGFRNSYGSVYHSNGFIYATDNGPNKGYGKRSVTCNSEDDDPWHPDSLVLVHKDGYYGFPNRARGSYGDVRQCVYHAPTEKSKNGFTSALATFEASTNGLIEYTANCFQGQLRGDLLVSKYAVAGSGKLYRVSLDATGTKRVGDVEELAQFSGLSIAMNPFGVLVMPRVQQPNIAVLMPDEEDRSTKEPHITAVMPNRGLQAGGNQVAITGENLTKGARVFFGEASCRVVRRSPTNDWLLCVAPPGKGAVNVVAKTAEGATQSIHKNYFYLEF